MNLAGFLIEKAPPSNEQSDKETLMAVDAWKDSDYLYQNYIVNGLSNALYEMYCSTKTTKKLWKILDRKYKTENVGTKKFIVGRYWNLKMVDSKPLINEVHELQVFIQEIHSERTIICKAFQVTSIIKKLQPRWKDFNSYLKHKRKEVDVETFVGKLCIKDDNRRSNKRFLHVMVKTNIMEHSQSSKNKKKTEKDFKDSKLELK